MRLRSFVVAQPVIEMVRSGEVSFGRIGLELLRCDKGRFSRLETFRGMIVSLLIQPIIAEHELAKCGMERRVLRCGSV